MKHLIVAIVLLAGASLIGQIRNYNDIPKDILDQLYKMGVDNSPLLNSYESAYLNIIFQDSLKGFDFTGKKIGFLLAGGKRDKGEYFNMHKKSIVDNNSPYDQGTLYIFDAVQKEESGGYDAAIVYWSKMNLPIENVVEKLKNQSAKE